MSLPTQGEEYSKLLEFLRKAQESSAMLAHLASANDDRVLAKGWLGIEELLKRMATQITKLAMGKLQ